MAGKPPGGNRLERERQQPESDGAENDDRDLSVTLDDQRAVRDLRGDERCEPGGANPRPRAGAVPDPAKRIGGRAGAHRKDQELGGEMEGCGELAIHMTRIILSSATSTHDLRVPFP